MRIGIFDSGIGGLTVLKKALAMMPNEDYIYYADALHVPYGTKPIEEVRAYIFEAAEFIAAQGVKAMVIACNTATSIAVNDLRRNYDFPIIGMEPAVKPAVERCNGKRVLVVATPLTLQEEKFHNLVARVDHDNIVDSLPLPELVDFAERFDFSEDTVLPYLSESLKKLQLDQYGTLVLGCTHFPFFESFFRRIFKENIDIIDGSSGTVKRLKNVLEEKYPQDFGKGSGDVIYYTSAIRESDTSKFNRFLSLL